MAANDSAGQQGGRPTGELTYTEASRELDEIVRFFEQREVDVDQLVGRLERATAIVDELDRRLRRTRGQVEELVPRLAAVLSSDGPPDDDVTDREGNGAGGGSRGTAEAAAVEDQAVEDQAVEEAELDEADELVEVMEDVMAEDMAGGVASGDELLDDGDPGPTEPQGLF